MVVRELFAVFGIDYQDAGAKKAESSLEKLKTGALKLATVFGTALSARAFVGMVQEVANTLDRLDDTSKRIGVSTKALQEMGHVAKLNGVEFSQMADGLRFLARNSAEAGQKGGDLADAFKALGASVKGPDGQIKSVESLLPEVANGMAGLTSHSDKVAYAMKIFGRSGANLIPVLDLGAEGIQKLAADAHALGGVIGQDVIDQASIMNDELDRARLAFFGLKTAIVATVLPAATKLGNWLAKGVAWLNQFQKGTNLIKIALILLGTAITALGAAAIAPMLVLMAPFLLLALKITAAIAALALIVDELIVTFQGGDTIIRRVIDSLFGIGATQSVVDALKTAFEFIWWLSLRLGDGLDAIWEMLWGNFEPLKGLFSTLKDAAAEAFKFWKEQFLQLGEYVPDFVKTGFSAVRNFVTGDGPQTLPTRAPSSATDNRTQVANVNVNVATGADPNQIASEASRQVREAMASERRTAMESLSQYAPAS
jgi:hypothetical protein